jgi:DNA mismatch repair protein MutL
MSSKIQILPDHVSQVIAAGEVVERPASAVKELVENSIDAGCSRVIVELGGGGMQFIRVRDDGEGMTPEEVPLSLQRHATSKIREAGDLFAINTFGFRGEALPSIASVSNMTLLTRTRQSISGTKVVCVAGEIRSIGEIGCPVGTEVEVRDIFFNVPVKRKFLKSIRSELHQALNHFLKLSLAHPSVAFKFIHDGRTLHELVKTESPQVRVEAIVGKETYDHLQPFTFEDGETRISGFASLPSISRKSADGIYLYVNQRFVKDRMVYKAVTEAYRHVIPAGRFPAVVLHVVVPPYAVDVNVHPTKAEVKFRDPERVFQAVYGALHSLLEPASYVAPSTRQEAPLTSFDSREDSVRGTHLSHVPAQLSFPKGYEGGFLVARDAVPVKEEFAVKSRVRILGQIHGTYLLGEIEEGLVLIDQHAAHERILFERFKKQYETRSVPVVQYLIPIMLELTAEESSIVSSYVEEFHAMGFEIDQAGEKDYALRSAPSLIPEKDIAELIREILKEVAFLKKEGRGGEILHTLLISLSCHSAIRANAILRREEIEELITTLSSYSFSATCPHGRPIFFVLTSDDLARQFKRK